MKKNGIEIAGNCIITICFIVSLRTLSMILLESRFVISRQSVLKLNGESVFAGSCTGDIVGKDCLGIAQGRIQRAVLFEQRSS